jgi:hypothetical protein
MFSQRSGLVDLFSPVGQCTCSLSRFALHRSREQLVLFLQCFGSFLLYGITQAVLRRYSGVTQALIRRCFHKKLSISRNNIHQNNRVTL